MDCQFDHSSLFDRKPIFSKRSLNVTLVEFNKCIPPTADILYSILRKQNIIASSVQELSVGLFQVSSTDLQPDNFKGLSLSKLSVKCFILEICKLDPSIFEELEAHELYMERIELIMLNKFTAKKVTMKEGKISGGLSS